MAAGKWFAVEASVQKDLPTLTSDSWLGNRIQACREGEPASCADQAVRLRVMPTRIIFAARGEDDLSIDVEEAPDGVQPALTGAGANRLNSRWQVLTRRFG
jgi:hypothetical protein